MTKPIISVVLGSYNRKSYLKLTIYSIRKELVNFPHEIIVVDGGSSDGSLKWLMKQKDIITIVQHNRGKWNGEQIKRRSWGYFMNLGFKSAQGNYVCMLSDDCLIVPGAILNGYDKIEEEIKKGNKVGSVAFYFRNWPEDEKYFVGFVRGKMMVNHGIFLRKALSDVGFIDEDNYMFYFADGDLALRMWQAGYSCIDSTKSFIEHFSHANKFVRRTNNRSLSDDLKQFNNRWSGDEVRSEGFEKNRLEIVFTDNAKTADIYKREFLIFLFFVKLMIYFEKNNLLMSYYKKIRKFLPL